MKIAVIMAAHGAERFIEAALASLLRQRDAAELDIIVINDGSTDATPQLVERLAAQAPEIRLLDLAPPGEKRGVSAARNAGLEAMTPDTDLWTCLDADDLSPAGRFARDVKLFADDPLLELHYGFMNLFRETEAGDALEPLPLAAPIRVRGMQLGAMLQRVALQRRVGLFDVELAQAEDADFLFRTIEAQPRMQLTDEVCVHYRRHPGNLSKDLGTYRASFARVVLKSLRRRRTTGAPGVPAGFFDATQMPENAEWW